MNLIQPSNVLDLALNVIRSKTHKQETIGRKLMILFVSYNLCLQYKLIHECHSRTINYFLNCALKALTLMEVCFG